MEHDAVIETLISAGQTVLLTVRYFKPAALFLKRALPYIHSSQSPSILELERQWVVYVTIPLLFAYLSRFIPGTDKLRTNAFEVVGVNSASTGVVQCEDSRSLADWIRAITNNISALLTHMIKMSNRLLIPEDQVVHMTWTQERVSPMRHFQAWNQNFSVSKAQKSVCLMFLHKFAGNIQQIECLQEVRKNSKQDKSANEMQTELSFIAASLQQCLQQVCSNVCCRLAANVCRKAVFLDVELLDDRQHCCTIHCGTGEKFYLSTESRSDLLHLEKAWYKTYHTSITSIKSKTFGCTWRGQLSGLTLDLESAFSLYDNTLKSYMWTYKFSQLKGFSDDNRSKLRLHFHSAENSNNVETREIQCSSLHTLLYCIHAFLSAKLASVDPLFLGSH
ncbi:gamma-1-syntrophin-like [Saccostrea echinata]|uniref:gamma-1-syntrophin-like n=1 Tax=Saccostrea echinata TaxID=191078 RepID=UPI002A81F129|nr:gamma-1-syntrophin-like [Saccostrea echinata]